MCLDVFLRNFGVILMCFGVICVISAVFDILSFGPVLLVQGRSLACLPRRDDLTPVFFFATHCDAYGALAAAGGRWVCGVCGGKTACRSARDEGADLALPLKRRALSLLHGRRKGGGALVGRVGGRSVCEFLACVVNACCCECEAKRVWRSVFACAAAY